MVEDVIEENTIENISKTEQKLTRQEKHEIHALKREAEIKKRKENTVKPIRHAKPVKTLLKAHNEIHVPCDKHPVNILSGLSPDHCKSKLFKDFYTSENKILDIYTDVVYPPYNLTKRPDLELEKCAFLEPPCDNSNFKMAKEVRSTWNLIPDDVFKKVVKNNETYTCSKETSVQLLHGNHCDTNGEINLKVTVKNKKGKPKPYGGDLIIARLVPLDYPNYKIYNQADQMDNKNTIYDLTEKFKNKANDKIFDKDTTIIPGHVVDNKNGTYDISIPCKVVGKFKVQVFMLRNAEVITALVHSYKSFNNKGGHHNRYFRGLFEDENSKEKTISEYCDPLVPDLLPDSPSGRSDNICTISNRKGNEWYCEKPLQDPKLAKNKSKKSYSINCSDLGRLKMVSPIFPNHTIPKTWHWKENKNQSIYNLEVQYGLGKQNEELLYETEITVEQSNSDSAKEFFGMRNSNNKAPSHDLIAGYFHQGYWRDRNLPNFAAKLGEKQDTEDSGTKFELFENKTLIRLGDSILKQLMKLLITDIIDEKKEHDLKMLENGNNEISVHRTRTHHPHANRNHAKHFLTEDGLINPLDFQDQFVGDCLSDITSFIQSPRSINFTNYIFNHGMPLNMGGMPHCIGRSIYSVEVFERMIEYEWFGKDYIIVLNHGAHFANWHPIILYNRLISIKQAAIKYKKFSPNTPIIFKTFNYVRGPFKLTYGITSGFIPFWQRDMVFKIFGNPYLDDMRDDEKFPVKVVDVLPMSLAVFDHFRIGDVHPLPVIARVTGNMIIDMLRNIGYF